MKIDGVFSGDGVKVYALLGALQKVSEHNHSFERVAGSSTGAIMATFLAANYQTKEINKMVQELETKQLLDPPKYKTIMPFSKCFNLYFQLGLYKGNKLENWIYQQLAIKNIYSFYDLKPGCLKLVISDISIGKLVVIPDDLNRIYGINPDNFPVAKAVRMSTGLPYYFMPKTLPGKRVEKSLIVDGEILSDFPLWVFKDGNKRKKRPVLGMTLSGYPKQGKQRDIKNSLGTFHELYTTILNGHDACYVSQSDKDNIIFIPVEHTETTNFDSTNAAKEQLIHMGRQKADSFLKHWPK